MYLTVTQVAAKLNISTGRAKQLIELGVLVSLPIPEGVTRKYYRVAESSVLAYRRSLNQAPKTEETKPEPQAPATTVPEGFITIKEAVTLSGWDSDTPIQNKIARGLLDKIKVGGRAYVRGAQVPRKVIVAQPDMFRPKDAPAPFASLPPIDAILGKPSPTPASPSIAPFFATLNSRLTTLEAVAAETVPELRRDLAAVAAIVDRLMQALGGLS